MRNFATKLFIERNKAVAKGEYIPEDLVTSILKLEGQFKLLDVLSSF